MDKVGKKIKKSCWGGVEAQLYQSTFKRQPVTFVRGEGTRVWDSDGKMYLDLVAGIAVNVLGHCHPAIIEAVQYQVTQLVHVSNLYYNTRQIELAEQLGLLSNGMRSFFSNSGAEANEGAIKLARKYGRLHRNGAYEIISMERSFHGRTLATTSATGQKKYQDTWLPLADGFKQVPFNDLEAVKAATSAKTIGILVEELQGKHQIITGTRGMGLMRAFDLAAPRAQEIMDRALEQGVLITNAGPSTIRFVPPLIVQRAEIDEAIEKIDAALAGLK